MDSKLMTRAADNIRVLVASMVEKAKSGHPGGAMGGADFANVLFSRFMVYDPENPEWIARDRFFLDPGHMSTMLYAVLALTGRYTMSELQEFRQWGSVTPGHPELDVCRGVENASGPLGQGHVMAVGCAIGERFLAAKFGKVVEHKTYAFISDGGIEEEISQGAGRIAGKLGLHNLIMFYDSNKVQLSTTVDEVMHEDTAAKYRSWGWNVIDVDGSDPEALTGALEVAHKEKCRPTLIIGHTVMAKGAVAADGSSLEGQVNTHGQPLSKAGADISLTIKNLGGDPENPWRIYKDVENLYFERKEELKHIVAERHREEHEWRISNPGLAEELDGYIAGRLPELDWSAIEFKADMATRNASASVLSYMAQHVGNMIVSSADLANSDKTDGFLKKTHAMQPGDFSGAFLQAGVSELTMACIMNGIALHGGLIAACGTFFVFSDYMKPAIRMSSLMELPVKFIFTHDAFRVGEDGPTHQPIEQEAQARLLEQMSNFSGKPAAVVLRPADSMETAACYKIAMENTSSPSIMILSRQDLKDIEGESLPEVIAGCEKGAYIVKNTSDPKVILVGNGSEVSLLCEVADVLGKDGVDCRVVSMPSVGIFAGQSKEYRDSIIPSGSKIFAVTSGLPAVFAPIRTAETEIYGLERFGASAPYKVLDEKFGFTCENIVSRVKQFLRI